MPRRSTWNLLPSLLVALGAGSPGAATAQDDGQAAPPSRPPRWVTSYIEAGLGLGAHRAPSPEEPTVEFAAVSDVSAGLRFQVTPGVHVGGGLAAHATASRYGTGQGLGLEVLTRVSLRSGAAVSGAVGFASGVDSASPDARLARLVLEPSEGLGLVLEGVSMAREYGTARDWGVMAGIRFGGRAAVTFAILHGLLAAGTASR